MNRAHVRNWREDDMWLGYIREQPDVISHAETPSGLVDMLRDAYETMYPGRGCPYLMLEGESVEGSPVDGGGG